MGGQMAAVEHRDAVLRRARTDWELMPLDGVGPLRFGMPIIEVAAALSGMSELHRFQAGPSEPNTLGVAFGERPTEPAVYGYFIRGQLFCVAVDAAFGPQVTLWGRELTACVPADLERFLLHASECGALGVSYGPRGNPGAAGIGLVLRVQEVAGNAVTRPVMVGRGWEDRCTDDWEGPIPECEWIGRQWFYPGYSEYWPPPGHATSWGDWQPPF
ncbi:hypothetical protein ACGFZP_31600 [Kitasatospora sp. NPDC048239]|uniref:hypothetical protein n=1 Tax=Kitasatospora sp. NPDC048239 TaxID=3364046 RepID=UPI00371E55B5